jgi:hypothetical protein
MKYFYTCMVLLALVVFGTYYGTRQQDDLPEQGSVNIATNEAPVPPKPQNYSNAQSINEPLQDSIKLYEETIFTEEQHEAYKLYSEIYNGILDVDSESNSIDEKYRLLPHEVDFVLDNEVDFITSILIKSMDEPLFPIVNINSLEMNAFNLQALNMARTIKGLEKEVQYYFPDYHIGAKFPAKKEFSRSNDFPTSVEKFMVDIVSISFTFPLSDSRIHLAKAKFLEVDAARYGPSGHPQIVELYAKAQQSLKSNTLRDYIATKYPEHFESFLEQSAQTDTK